MLMHVIYYRELFFMECPDSYMEIENIGTLPFFPVIFQFFSPYMYFFLSAYLKMRIFMLHLAYSDPWQLFRNFDEGEF